MRITKRQLQSFVKKMSEEDGYGVYDQYDLGPLRTSIFNAFYEEARGSDVSRKQFEIAVESVMDDVKAAIRDGRRRLRDLVDGVSDDALSDGAERVREAGGWELGDDVYTEDFGYGTIEDIIDVGGGDIEYTIRLETGGTEAGLTIDDLEDPMS